MLDLLRFHVRYVAAADPVFHDSWTIHSGRCVLPLTTLTRETESLDLRESAWKRLHSSASDEYQRLCQAIPDFDFQCRPRPAHWIARSMAQPAADLFEHWRVRLDRLLGHALRERLVWFGCTKSEAGIVQRVQKWRGGGMLDLWDSVRYRIIVPTVRHAIEVAKCLLREFHDAVVRCRNYFVRPRNSPLDPYRAIHLEFQSDAEDFVEVQIITSRREAVGLIDHSVVHKRRVPFLGSRHAAWLRRLSWAANILDWRDAVGASNEYLWTWNRADQN